MSNYDVDFDIQVENLEVPSRRLDKFIAFLKSLAKPLNWLHTLTFSDYIEGQSYPAFGLLANYVVGDRVTYTDLANYECIAPTVGNTPLNTDYWIKIQDVYIGYKERASYNGQKVMLEYVLNRYFNTTVSALPTIYIDTIPTLASNIYVYPLTNVANTYIAYPAIIPPSSYAFTTAYSATAYSYTIYVPAALYAAIDANSAYADAKIMALVDKYNVAGLNYNIVSY